MVWTQLKNAINNAIKANNNQEITGQVLNNTLNTIVNSIGKYATFAGIATPGTNPGVFEGPVVYFANTTGIYPNFGNITVKANQTVMLYSINGNWESYEIANNAINALASGVRFTYWEPTAEPVLNANGTLLSIKYNRLTLVDLVTPHVYSFGKSTVTFQKNQIILIYADLSDKKLYYSYIVTNSTTDFSGDYKKITDISTIVPLLVVDRNGYFEDMMKRQSRSSQGHIPSLSTDIFNLTPEANKAILFNKYECNITGSVVDSTSADIRLTTTLHIKHKFIYIEGQVVSEGPVVVKLYIDDNNTTGTGYKNLVIKEITPDAEGNFCTDYYLINSSIWNSVNFTTGYRVFILVENSGKYKTSLFVNKAFVCDNTGKDNEVIIPCEGIKDAIDFTKNYKQQFEDTIQYTDALKSFINVGNTDKTFGYYSTEVLGSAFPVQQHVNYSATTKNSEAQSDGYLTEVSALVYKVGTYIFRIGLLDQYSRFVVSREFKLALKNGLNTVDISDMNIEIYKGEQLAISATSIDTDNSSLMFKANSETEEHEMIYGPNNDVWKKLNTTYGGKIILSYKMKELGNTIFALKSELDSAYKQIDSQNEIINGLRYVYDNAGVPYKLSINNGNVVAKPIYYKKVLALGNSLTSHGYASGIGYFGDEKWAMASTNKETTTWTTHLQNILRQKQADATVTPFNIAAWETNYMGVNLDNLFAAHTGTNYDLIIVRAGENGTAGDDYAQGIDRLITFLMSKFTHADIVITDMFWHNDYKESCFKQIADKYRHMYIPFGKIADTCLLGQMLMGRDDTFHPITHNGVAGHCTDVCFFDFANILANALSYSKISGKYAVDVNTYKKYKLNNVNQIKDGYVTILTYDSASPSISVKKESGDAIQVSTINISNIEWINTPSEIPTYASVFQMPDENVIVTL